MLVFENEIMGKKKVAAELVQIEDLSSLTPKIANTWGVRKNAKFGIDFLLTKCMSFSKFWMMLLYFTNNGSNIFSDLK